MKLKMKEGRLQEVRLQGTPISRGIAIGKAFYFYVADQDPPEFTISKKEIEDEVKRYYKALLAARREIKRLQRRLEKEHAVEGAAILEAHLQIMQDSLLTHKVEHEIRTRCKNAEFCLQLVIAAYRGQFSGLSDPLFRERFKEIEDIYRRVLGHLLKSVQRSMADVPEGSVVFASEVAVADIAEAKKPQAAAFVTEHGGLASHAAIVAKARGIPFVTNVPFDNACLEKAEVAIVDGRVGHVILNPDAATLSRYESIKDQYDASLKELRLSSDRLAETYDGHTVGLFANIDLAADVAMVHDYGGDGVGLLRTEHLFMDRTQLPDEEEQYAIYSDIVMRMRGKPIVIRVFDIGGDKLLRNQLRPLEDNPFLGCRAIRFLLRDGELFKAQLKAILRAGVHGDVRLLFPMISSLGELLEAKQYVREAQAELKKQRVPFVKQLLIGSMIEVPSAAVIADLLAKECDFLSIGTNDLVQYALAVDRGNHTLHDLYTPSHPSVLRLIKMVVEEGRRHGIPVSICGEVASDPRYTALLLGLGVSEFSVAFRYIPIVKDAIRNARLSDAKLLADAVLNLTTAKDIETLLDLQGAL